MKIHKKWWFWLIIILLVLIFILPVSCIMQHGFGGYRSNDGCNTCSCGFFGESCTMLACSSCLDETELKCLELINKLDASLIDDQIHILNSGSEKISVNLIKVDMNNQEQEISEYELSGFDGVVVDVSTMDVLKYKIVPTVYSELGGGCENTCDPIEVLVSNQ